MAVKAGDMEVVYKRSKIEGAWWFLAGIGFALLWALFVVHVTGVVACR